MEPEELQLGFLKMLRGTGLRIQAEKYGYVYMDHAPYEMLYNHYISFADISRVKRVEDILDKYWNDHRMDHTISYVVHSEFATPFDFFQEFRDYWHKKGWGKIGHQLEDLFIRLQQFLSHQRINNLDIIEGLMTYDYFLHQKHKPRKSWGTPVLSKDQHVQYIQLFKKEPELIGLPPAFFHHDWAKHAVVEKLPFSLETYLHTGEIVRNSEILFVHYHTKTKRKTIRHVPLRTLETTTTIY